MKQHSSYKVKVWTSTQVSWSLDLILRSGSMQMCGYNPLHWFALVSTNRQRLSLSSSPSALKIKAFVALHPHWHPVGQPGSAARHIVLECILTSFCWGLPSLDNKPQIKAYVHLGSVCTLNTSPTENSCNRRSLHPRDACSPGKGGPQCCIGSMCTIRKKMPTWLEIHLYLTTTYTWIA